MNLKYFLLGAFLLSGINLMGMEEPSFKKQKTESEQKELNGQLFDAAEDGDLEEVERLIDEGAEVNAPNEEDDAFTPLHVAANEGHLDVVQCLVLHGANMNATTDDGATPFSEAFPFHLDVARFLAPGTRITKQELGAKLATYNPHPEILSEEAIKLVLDQEADVNTIGENGMTPLFNAISGNNVEMVRLLLEKNAQVNAKATGSPIGWLTHLQEACAQLNKPQSGQRKERAKEIVKLLIAKGAQLNLGNKGQFASIRVKDKPLIAALLLGDNVMELINGNQYPVSSQDYFIDFIRFVTLALKQGKIELVVDIAKIKHDYMRSAIIAILEILDEPSLAQRTRKYYESLVLRIAQLRNDYGLEVPKLLQRRYNLKKATLTKYALKSYVYLEKQLSRRLTLVDQIMCRGSLRQVLLDNVHNLETHQAIRINPTYVLCKAVQDGDIKIATFALKYKANPNAEVQVGSSEIPLLVLAAMHKDREISKQLVELLLSHGALSTQEIIATLCSLESTEGMQEIISLILAKQLQKIDEQTVAS